MITEIIIDTIPSYYTDFLRERYNLSILKKNKINPIRK